MTRPAPSMSSTHTSKATGTVHKVLECSIDAISIFTLWMNGFFFCTGTIQAGQSENRRSLT
eukprot:m.123863 g.123863  ORF g.123863 m.123863 type:complete len:61 (+) comp17280_c1_seq1:44-226(+)